MNSTRTSIHRSHALVSPDGYVNSVWPDWDRCTVHVLINKAMGADFCQNLIIAGKETTIKGQAVLSQILFYVIQGSCTVSMGNQRKQIRKGHFVYVAVGSNYRFEHFNEDTQLLSFHKVFEILSSKLIPEAIIGDAAELPGLPFMGDPALMLQNLLPDDPAFDMAVNIFTFQPGAKLPFVETHIMEHGLYFLQGKGLYRLADRQYDVQKGDTLWMAPYCSQWFEAYAPEPAVYIYYKNVNRPAIEP